MLAGIQPAGAEPLLLDGYQVAGLACQNSLDLEQPPHDHAHIADLVEQVRNDNDLAWREIIDTFGPMMERTATRLGVLPEDAADVPQKTFITLFRHIDTLQQPERLAGWLKIATIRNARRFLETAYRYISTDSEEFAWVLATTEATGESIDQ